MLGQGCCGVSLGSGEPLSVYKQGSDIMLSCLGDGQWYVVGAVLM